MKFQLPDELLDELVEQIGKRPEFKKEMEKWLKANHEAYVKFVNATVSGAIKRTFEVALQSTVIDAAATALKDLKSFDFLNSKNKTK